MVKKEERVGNGLERRRGRANDSNGEHKPGGEGEGTRLLRKSDLADFEVIFFVCLS